VGHGRRADDGRAAQLPRLARHAGQEIPADLNKAEASEQIERLQEKKDTASPQSDDAS
jgi:hypothetical protein